MQISSKVGGIDGLSADTFERLPALSDSGRYALVLNLCVYSCDSLSEGTLHEMALRISRSQEDSVDEE